MGSTEVWGPPPQDRYKLNFNGSFHHQNQLAGIWGIVVAFFVAIEAHKALEADNKAIICGVQFFVDLNLSNVLIEGDSYIIWNTLHTGGTVSWHLIKG